jgi:hypothetical protein
MPKAYSRDLRERVVRYVDEGHSRRAAAVPSRTFACDGMRKAGLSF